MAQIDTMPKDPSLPLMEEIASDAVIDRAYAWLYARRWWRWANAGIILTDLTGLTPGADAAALLTIE